MRIYIFRDPESVTPHQLEQELLPQLPAWRRQRALEYSFHLGRVLSAQAYLLLKRGLAEDFNIVEDVTFDYLEHNKPIIKEFPNLHFNFSHCKKAVMCVLDDKGSVGCDVEVFNRKIGDALIRKCCNEQEIQWIRQSQDPQKEFVRLWTRKEALLKYSGRGLINDLPGLMTPERVSTVSLLTFEEADFVYTTCQKK